MIGCLYRDAFIGNFPLIISPGLHHFLIRISQHIQTTRLVRTMVDIPSWGLNVFFKTIT